jgi:phosphate transport system substrate-binding protein
MSLLRIPSLFVLFILIGCGPKEIVNIAGSETMLPMIELAGKSYTKNTNQAKIEVKGGGSEEGLKLIQEKKIDIATSSRELTDQENVLLIKRGGYEKLLIAYDGVAIIVHPKNPIQKITLEQAHALFSGEITNWKWVGGNDQEITPVIRNDKSGTNAFFQEFVLRKRLSGEKEYQENKTINYATNSKIVKNNKEMSEYIQSNPGSIGYMGMGSASLENKDLVKLLEYSPTGQEPYVVPSIKNVFDRKYRLSRPLYILYRPDNGGKVDSFISYLTGSEGQKEILKSGYLRSALDEIEVKPEDLEN